MVNVLDYDIVVSEFELLLGYYVHFWTNTMNGLELDNEKFKIGKLPVLMKYPQKYRRQENLTTYCSDIATPYITKTQ